MRCSVITSNFALLVGQLLFGRSPKPKNNHNNRRKTYYDGRLPAEFLDRCCWIQPHSVANWKRQLLFTHGEEASAVALPKSANSHTIANKLCTASRTIIKAKDTIFVDDTRSCTRSS